MTRVLLLRCRRSSSNSSTIRGCNRFCRCNCHSCHTYSCSCFRCFRRIIFRCFPCGWCLGHRRCCCCCCSVVARHDGGHLGALSRYPCRHWCSIFPLFRLSKNFRIMSDYSALSFFKHRWEGSCGSSSEQHQSTRCLGDERHCSMALRCTRTRCVIAYARANTPLVWNRE